MTQTATSKDGTRIAYQAQGAGQPLILVDGAMCSRAFGPMPGLAPLLADHFTVITYDRRGRNESGDTLPYAVERELEDLAALIELAGGKADVYGVSSGGALGLRAAAAGLPIRRLAVYEPPFVADGGRAPLAEDTAAHLEHLAASGRRGDALEHFMVQMVNAPAESVAPMRASPMWPALEAVAHTLAYDARIMEGWSSRPYTPSVKIPVRVMDGGDSPSDMRRAALCLAEALSDAQYRTLPGQTHDAQPDVVAPALIEFFSA